MITAFIIMWLLWFFFGKPSRREKKGRPFKKCLSSPLLPLLLKFFYKNRQREQMPAICRFFLSFSIFPLFCPVCAKRGNYFFVDICPTMQKNRRCKNRPALRNRKKKITSASFQQILHVFSISCHIFSWSTFPDACADFFRQ